MRTTLRLRRRSTVSSEGRSLFTRLLKGASTVDKHIKTAPFEKNLPVILPYSQALDKFAPRIQHISMESNGKGVSIDGVPLPYEADEIDFGEPGTNGQYSFYQLIHPPSYTRQGGQRNWKI